MGSRRLTLLAVALCLLAAACSRGADPAQTGWHALPDGEVAQYDTAYIAGVQVPTADTDGYILLANNWDGPADLGGWAIHGRGDRTVRIPPSTIIPPHGQLKVHLAAGDSDAGDLYVGAGEQILEWDRLRLVDAADSTVARFTYGR